MDKRNPEGQARAGADLILTYAAVEAARLLAAG